jgi:phospholysine phosphohistidine inorganic pyrophosphate phosphatase
MKPGLPSAYLFDLDGTLYSGGAAIPGAAETLRRLRSAGTPYRLVTNTTSRPRSALVQRLAAYGFDVAPEEIFTAILAAREVARTRDYTRVAPFVSPEALEDLPGLDLTGGTSGRHAGEAPQAVLVGDLGERWTYGLMQEAFEYLLAGAGFIALSRDRYWQQGNRLALDAGPFVAGLEFATGKTADMAGKPSPAFYQGALQSLGLAGTDGAVMIGDDLWSDVEGAQRAGLAGWLVRTGKFRQSTLDGSKIRPDRILDSVAALE